MCVWKWIQNICRVKQRNYMHINLPAMTAPYQRSTLLSIAESVPSHFCFFFLLLFRLLLLWLLFLFYYYRRELFFCYLTYIYIFVIICTHTICNDKFASIVCFSLSLSHLFHFFLIVIIVTMWLRLWFHNIVHSSVMSWIHHINVDTNTHKNTPTPTHTTRIQ